MEQNQQLLEQIQQKFLLKQMPAKEYSPLVLAYIGDGIYDMIVRTMLRFQLLLHLFLQRNRHRLSVDAGM